MTGTIYLYKDGRLRTRALVIDAIVKKYRLDFRISGPDHIFPSQFSGNRVPMMQWADGRLQEESIPITLAISELAPKESQLLGDGSIETRSLILQWMCKFNYDILLASVTPMFKLKAGVLEMDEAKYDAASQNFEAHSAFLESFLSKSKFLVGESVTVADYYCAATLIRGFQYFIDSKWRSAYPNLWDWWQRVAYDDLFDGTFKQLKFIE